MKMTPIEEEMIEKYYALSKKKKEIESEMNQLKDFFHTYFDTQYGEHTKGELTFGKYKLQRQIRKTEKYQEEVTVSRLEGLNMNDLIKIVKKPDEEKIKAAIHLGLIKEEDLQGCKIISFNKALSVKEI